MRRWFAAALTALVTALAVPLPLHAQAPQRPNVVLIMTDDLGYGDLGSYGAPDIRTPHIDSLARDGVRLTDFYANGVMCSPTRAGLISGRYQQRYLIESAIGNEGGPGSDRGLAATGRTLPQVLKNAGYATALVGKWHLGYSDNQSPGAHGFDYFFGLKSGYHDYYTHMGGSGMRDLWENDARIEREGYMTDLITERSVRFLEENASRPFFIDVSYNAPHWPYQVPGRPSVAIDNARHLMPHDRDTSTRANYVAMVEHVDVGVGEILRTLERLGLAGNTIVIFTNDNGGEWLSNNLPLFHRKWTTWEGGIRVPAIVRWPGRIAAGRVSDQVGITMDLTASILAVAGAEVPADARLEGINLFPILEGRAPEVERTLFWRARNIGGRNQLAVRSGDWKLMVDGNATFVFDLRTDPGERRDLANLRQDIAQRLRGLIARGPLPVNEALDYARQAADGLARAHEAGIMHRDIKPANLIVTERGEVKIVDFGLAKSAGSDPTRDGTAQGTVAYMSPEQTRGGPVDHRTDIWSLGALLYEMLTGRQPFPGDHDAVVIHAIRRDEPHPVDRLRPDVPDGVAQIVRTCLAKDPADRYQRTSDLVAALEANASSRPEEQAAADRPARASTPARRLRSARGVRSPRVGLLLGLIGLTAAAFLYTSRAGHTDGDAAALDSAGPRLAVLPFENLRPDPAIDFLGYALADEIIGRIGYLNGLTVRPASAVRRYQGQTIDPREVAGALGVDYLLTGSYLQEDDTLRVNIDLVNADSGVSEWREPIEVAYDSVFRLQDLVTQRVAQRLRLTWTLEAQERIARDVVSDPTAYHQYLSALGYPLGTKEGNRDAYELLSKSVDRDPTYAPAVAALGYRAYMLGINGFSDSRAAALAEAERLYERALRLNPDHVPGLARQALLFLETGRIEVALEPLRRALTIQPDAADAYLSLTHVYRKAGLLREAVRVYERGRSLDPTSPRLATGGLVYLYAGAYDEALELFALDPNAAPSLVWQGMALLPQGQPALARERFQEAVRRSPESPLGLIARAHVAYLDDDVRRGLDAARTLEVNAEPGGVHGEELYQIARLFCLFGDVVTGVRMLEQAVDHGFFPYPFILRDPFLDSVRDDAGFNKVVARARERHESFRTLVSHTELPR